MSTTVLLPPEMISDVLSRLPVKSLLRFRSASKPFCYLIDGPDFTKLHLNRSTQNHSKQSLVLGSYQIYSINLSSPEGAVEMEHPLKSVQGHTEVIDSCNGLLCLSNYKAEIIVLWNMSTGKHHRLPHVPTASPILHPPSYGLGYDSVHDDYKLMRIVRFNALDAQVMIYSLRSNSWEAIGRFPYELPRYRSSGVFAEGALYWLINRPEGDNVLTAFDLATQDYRLVPQLPVAPNGNMLRSCGRRLCAIGNYAGKQVVIWELKNECWAKLLSISDPRVTTSSECIAPIAYFSNGDQVLLLKDYEEFLRYDVKTKKVTNVRIHGMPSSFDAVPYVDSLVNPSPMASGDGATMGKHMSPRSKKNASKRDGFLSKGFKLVL